MGRPLIIIVGGLIVIVGLAQLGAWQRIDVLNQMNVNQYQETQLRNKAMGGLDLALRMNNIEGADQSEIEQATLSRGNVSVDLSVTTSDEESSLSDGQIRIIATATNSNEQSHQASAIVERGQTTVPTPDAAFGVYDEGSMIDIRGNPTISGEDDDGDDHLPGVVSWRDKDDVIEGRGGAYELKGEPDEFVKDQDLNDDQFEEDYQHFLNVGRPFSHESNYGTLNQPSVMIAQSDLEFTGGEETMSGIMVVPEGVTLRISGNFEFHGFILSKGTIDMGGGGNVDIYGGIMVGGNDGEAEIDAEEIFGNVTIQHRGSVRENLENNMRVPGNVNVVGIRN